MAKGKISIAPDSSCIIRPGVAKAAPSVGGGKQFTPPPATGNPVDEPAPLPDGQITPVGRPVRPVVDLPSVPPAPLVQ